MSQRLLSKYLWEEQCQWKKMRENCTLMFARGLCHFDTVCGILLKSEIPLEIFALKSRKIYNTQKCNRKLIFIETQLLQCTIALNYIIPMIYSCQRKPSY